MYTGKKDLKYVGYSNNVFDRLLKHELTWRYVKTNIYQWIKPSN